MLLSPRVLKFPDFSKPFYLITDASKIACGVVLCQEHDGHSMPIAYASKSFTKGESHKAPIEQELPLTIHWAINHFRPYLYGQQFIVRSDHEPLVHLFSMKNPSSKLTRMRLDLEEYDFIVEHIKGKDNVVADAISRISFDELKKIFIVTRSMKEKREKLTVTPNSALEPDQLHVYEAVNNLEAFSRNKLLFNISNNSFLNAIRSF